MSRATISFPVPCSPVTSTGTSEKATCSIMATTRCIASEVSPFVSAPGALAGPDTALHCEARG